MANGVFNVSKGRGNEFIERVEQDDPTGCEIVIMALKVAEADATLNDYDTFAALLAGSNTEADFTNYARKTLTAASVSRSVDDSGNVQTSAIVDQTFSSAGGASNNSLVKIVIGYDYLGTGVDANIVPISHHDYVATTDGNDLLVDFGASFYSAS